MPNLGKIKRRSGATDLWFGWSRAVVL